MSEDGLSMSAKAYPPPVAFVLFVVACFVCPFVYGVATSPLDSIPQTTLFGACLALLVAMMLGLVSKRWAAAEAKLRVSAEAISWEVRNAAGRALQTASLPIGDVVAYGVSTDDPDIWYFQLRGGAVHSAQLFMSKRREALVSAMGRLAPHAKRRE